MSGFLDKKILELVLSVNLPSGTNPKMKEDNELWNLSMILFSCAGFLLIGTVIFFNIVIPNEFFIFPFDFIFFALGLIAGFLAFSPLAGIRFPD